MCINSINILTYIVYKNVSHPDIPRPCPPFPPGPGPRLRRPRYGARSGGVANP